MGKIQKNIENENQNLVCAIILHWGYEVLKHNFIKNRRKWTLNSKDGKGGEAQLVKPNKDSYPLNSLQNGSTQVK